METTGEKHIDDVVRMAREAGAIPVHKEPTNFALVGVENIKRFAQLIAANAAAAEREACAKVADEFDPEMKMSNYGQVIANRIRARGQK